MIFRVELEDFYLESEENLKPALQSAIVSEIVARIREQIKPIVERDISDLIKSQLDNTVRTIVGEVSESFIQSGAVKDKYGKDGIPYKDFISARIVEQFPEQKLKDLVDKLVKENAVTVSNEMKSRYDIMFAAGVVKKMQEFGLMSNEIAQRLVNTTNSDSIK